MLDLRLLCNLISFQSFDNMTNKVCMYWIVHIIIAEKVDFLELATKVRINLMIEKSKLQTKGICYANNSWSECQNSIHCKLQEHNLQWVGELSKNTMIICWKKTRKNIQKTRFRIKVASIKLQVDVCVCACATCHELVWVSVWRTSMSARTSVSARTPSVRQITVIFQNY